jgi:hypothetical protein
MLEKSSKLFKPKQGEYVMNEIPETPLQAAAEPQKKSGFPMWLIILIVVILVCCCLTCLIVAISGPAINNIFASINESLVPVP